MIGNLPTVLEIGGKEYAIRSDFRVILRIYSAFADPELDESEKCYVCLKCLYAEDIPREHLQEAVNKAYWFVGGGDVPQESVQPAKTIDWEQDESIIFPAVNKAAGFETRTVKYLHWWTFLGYFNEIGKGLFSSVIGIRQKLNKGKKLEKYEQEFYRNHRNMIDLKRKLSAEEQRVENEDKEFLKQLTGGE